MAMKTMPSAPIPAPRKRVHLRLSPPRTLDRRGGLSTGALTAAAGVDPRRLPRLSPLPPPHVKTLAIEGSVTGMAYLEGRLYVCTIDEAGRGIFYCFVRGDATTITSYTPAHSLYAEREILQFNLYSDPTDPTGGHFRRMGLIFPDGLAFPLDTDAPVLERLARDDRPLPRLFHPCVHLSRLFGTDGDRIYASAYNDPRNFDLDTATDAGAANAWVASVQSNTSAGGDFTALTVFGGALHAFKEGFCHILSGTKNPFRVSDLFAVGTPSPASIAEVGGKLFFADEKEVYRYNGDTLTPIGGPLGERDLSGARGCACAGMDALYLPAAGELFLYAPESGAWSSHGRVAGERQVRFLCPIPRGMLLLDDAANLYAIGEADPFRIPDPTEATDALTEADPTEATAPTGETDAIGATNAISTGLSPATPRFSCAFAPIVGEGEVLLRLCRLSLTVEGEAGARVRAYYKDLSGREQALLDTTLSHTGLSRLCTRMFTPADRGGRICLCCEGQVSCEELSLLLEAQE